MNSFPSSIPRARSEAASLFQASQHILISQTIRNYGGCPDLVVMGDSIVQGWEWIPAWARLTKGRKVLNLGSGGDRTEHLLWRLEQGIIDSLPVTHAAVLIGVNNLWSNSPALEVISGIVACVQRIREGLPQAAIAVYGVLPLCGRNEHLNPVVNEINEKLPGLLTPFNIDFRDLGPRLRRENGEVPRELMPDGCHLSEEAYVIWTDDLIEWLIERTDTRADKA